MFSGSSNRFPYIILVILIHWIKIYPIDSPTLTLEQLEPALWLALEITYSTNKQATYFQGLMSLVISYLRFIVFLDTSIQHLLPFEIYTFKPCAKILRKHFHERDLETIGPDFWATRPTPMQWGNLPVPGHLRGGAAATAFFHYVCDYIYYSSLCIALHLNDSSKYSRRCFHIEFLVGLFALGFINPISLKISSTSLFLRSSTRNAISSWKSTESRSPSLLLSTFWALVVPLFLLMTQNCSSVIESLQDCESLQKDRDSLNGRSDNWQLKFNTSKCEVLTVTRKRHSFRYDYKLNNNSLEHVTQVKDLGVTISPDLTWDTHINNILAKANRMLAFLRRNSVMSSTVDHRKLLSLTFVRSYIGYASEVWAPSTIGSVTKIVSNAGQQNSF